MTSKAAYRFITKQHAKENIIIKKVQTFLENFDHLRITMGKNIPEPDPIISIKGSLISSPGNLTMISGASKAGKSAFCSVIIAGSIRGHNDPYDGFDPLYINGNVDKKAVIHIDTEQAKHNHYKNLKNAVLKRLSLDELPEYFFSYNIREMELKNRREFTEILCKEADKVTGGIHLIVIDGLADYISSVNDEIYANKLVLFFEKLSIKFNCPVIAIVHLNPNSSKERGHLGSQLQRKAESVIQIKKGDDDISRCEPFLLRNASTMDVPIIYFSYDCTKNYHTFESIRDSNSSENEKSNMLRAIIGKVFTEKPIQSKEVVAKIVAVTGKSEITAKRYLKEMKEIYNFIQIKQMPNQSKKEVFYVSLLG
jgi:hypothetical protein